MQSGLPSKHFPLNELDFSYYQNGSNYNLTKLNGDVENSGINLHLPWFGCVLYVVYIDLTKDMTQV